MEREYIVVLNKDVNYDQFWNEMENISSTDGFVPSRRVDIVNERPGSLRSCHYSLTNEEAEIRKNHQSCEHAWCCRVGQPHALCH